MNSPPDPSELKNKSGPSEEQKSPSEMWKERYGVGPWLSEIFAVILIATLITLSIDNLSKNLDFVQIDRRTMFGLLVGFGMALIGRLRTLSFSISPIHGIFEVKVGGALLAISNVIAIIIFSIVGFGSLTVGNYFTVMGAIFGILIAFFNLYEM